MTCQTVQNKILALPDPRLVPDPLREHVAGCGACREWARQAARLEGLLERLPAPPAPAGKKSHLIGDLTRPVPAAARPFAVPARPGESRVLSLLRRNAAVVGGLAAALLVAVGAWSLFPRPGKPETAQPTPEHPFLKKMVQRDVALAKADTPAKRLQALAGMADDISAEARVLARVASPDELKDFARWYDKAKDGLVKQAEKLPVHAMTPAERKAQFEELAAKLDATAAEADKLTGEIPPDAKPALHRIAESARDGQKKLRELNN